jgi:hypothetical protein
LESKNTHVPDSYFPGLAAKILENFPPQNTFPGIYLLLRPLQNIKIHLHIQDIYGILIKIFLTKEEINDT